ncbi:MAG TPA: double-strand break repair protein AddB [Magnetospirillaceae bacterium]
MSRASSVFTIPPGENFVAALARQLLTETAGDPLALSAMLILLPTRRAARALREAFLAEANGRPLLLPRMRPLGDVDDDDPSLGDAPASDVAPAIAPLRRRLLLARLIMGLDDAQGGARTAEQAVPLGEELARLLDQVQIEELSFDDLQTLVPDDYAEHWQVTLRFLSLLTEHWPTILRSEGALDPAERRGILLATQAEAWRTTPPDYPIIAAGSTGSIPATRRLLQVVAGLPRGRLILPGLDRAMDAESREALEESHPQWGLFRLLDALEIAPHQVPLWPGTHEVPRAGLIAEAMRPAATTDAWRDLKAEAMRDSINGITRIDCPGPQDEAAVIALRLRAALEEPGKTAALVTPDRDLARRVTSALRRFGIDIDDSAGTPLTLTEPGAFLLLTAIMVAEDFAPHATLAALKHPLASGGMETSAFRRLVRRLDRDLLRGPRPAPGIAGLRNLPRVDGDFRAWLDRLDAITAPLVAALAKPTSLHAILEAHIDCAEKLAADIATDGAARLWAGDAGTTASSFVLELAEAADKDVLPPITGAGYPSLLRTLMRDAVVRPSWGKHPRLAIWGPLEARLQQADVLILGGLNEGTWPSETLADPWMSRPMRVRFGLPAPERRIGLSAHDFAQAAAAPEVILTRAERVGGTPTVPSRWLMRLDAVLAACGLDKLPRDPRWLSWHEAMDRPAETPEPPRPPAPCPPLAARPRRLPVTAIELWRRDPYALYAQRILRLRALDPIDADPDAAEYGTVVHKAFDAFLRLYPNGPLPRDAETQLLAQGEAAFGDAFARPGVWAFWWPRFQRIAHWFIEKEIERRQLLAQASTEVSGTLTFAAPGGDFIVEAKADRVDRQADGSLIVIDYKTGAVPKAKEVEAGFAPQLPLEGAIAVNGGFTDIPAGTVLALLYWQLSGGATPGKERAASAKIDANALIREALEGLSALVAAFDDPATAYQARPHPTYVPRYSDYLHLARVKEWSSGEEGE